MANDWFDPFGVRRITDAMSTTAARSLVGRPVQVESHALRAVVAAVHEAAPSTNVGAMLSGQIGLWRRLDVELGEVAVHGNRLDRVRVRADDVRAIEALPQRVGAQVLDVDVHAGAEATRGWIETLAPAEADVRIADGELLARLPGLGSFGEAILDPWCDGRTVGIDVDRARLRSREVAIPQRFRRRFTWELDWLPPDTTLIEVAITADDGVMVRGTVDHYSIELDVPRLMADLTSRQAGAAIDVLLGG